MGSIKAAIVLSIESSGENAPKSVAKPDTKEEPTMTAVVNSPAEETKDILLTSDHSLKTATAVDTVEQSVAVSEKTSDEPGRNRKAEEKEPENKQENGIGSEPVIGRAVEIESKQNLPVLPIGNTAGVSTSVRVEAVGMEEAEKREAPGNSSEQSPPVDNVTIDSGKIVPLEVVAAETDEGYNLKEAVDLPVSTVSTTAIVEVEEVALVTILPKVVVQEMTVSETENASVPVAVKPASTTPVSTVEVVVTVAVAESTAGTSVATTDIPAAVATATANIHASSVPVEATVSSEPVKELQVLTNSAAVQEIPHPSVVDTNAILVVEPVMREEEPVSDGGVTKDDTKANNNTSEQVQRPATKTVPLVERDSDSIRSKSPDKATIVSSGETSGENALKSVAKPDTKEEQPTMTAVVNSSAKETKDILLTSDPSLKTAVDTVEQLVAVSEKTSEPGRNRKEEEKEPENKQENGIGSEPGVGLAVEVESKQNLPVLPSGNAAGVSTSVRVEGVGMEEAEMREAPGNSSEQSPPVDHAVLNITTIDTGMIVPVEMEVEVVAAETDEGNIPKEAVALPVSTATTIVEVEDVALVAILPKVVVQELVVSETENASVPVAVKPASTTPVSTVEVVVTVAVAESTAGTSVAIKDIPAVATATANIHASSVPVEATVSSEPVKELQVLTNSAAVQEIPHPSEVDTNAMLVVEPVMREEEPVSDGGVTKDDTKANNNTSEQVQRPATKTVPLVERDSDSIRSKSPDKATIVSSGETSGENALKSVAKPETKEEQPTMTAVVNSSAKETKDILLTSDPSLKTAVDTVEQLVAVSEKTSEPGRNRKEEEKEPENKQENEIGSEPGVGLAVEVESKPNLPAVLPIGNAAGASTSVRVEAVDTEEAGKSEAPGNSSEQSPPVDHAVLNVTTIDAGMIVPVDVEVVAAVAETDEEYNLKEAVAMPVSAATAIVEVEEVAVVATLPKVVVQEMTVAESENTENASPIAEMPGSASVPVSVKLASTIPVSTVEAVVTVAVAESTPATANIHASPVPVESTVLVETTEPVNELQLLINYAAVQEIPHQVDTNAILVEEPVVHEEMPVSDGGVTKVDTKANNNTSEQVLHPATNDIITRPKSPEKAAIISNGETSGENAPKSAAKPESKEEQPTMTVVVNSSAKETKDTLLTSDPSLKTKTAVDTVEQSVAVSEKTSERGPGRKEEEKEPENKQEDGIGSESGVSRAVEVESKQSLPVLPIGNAAGVSSIVRVKAVDTEEAGKSEAPGNSSEQSPPVDHAVLNVTTIDTGMIVPVVVEVVAVVAETDEGNIPKEAVALPESTAIVEVEDVALVVSLPKAVVQELVVSETENTENASVPVAVKSATTIPVSTMEAVVAVAESTPATANFHASPVPVESTVLVETTEPVKELQLLINYAAVQEIPHPSEVDTNAILVEEPVVHEEMPVSDGGVTKEDTKANNNTSEQVLHPATNDIITRPKSPENAAIISNGETSGENAPKSVAKPESKEEQPTMTVVVNSSAKETKDTLLTSDPSLKTKTAVDTVEQLVAVSEKTSERGPGRKEEEKEPENKQEDGIGSESGVSRAVEVESKQSLPVLPIGNAAGVSSSVRVEAVDTEEAGKSEAPGNSLEQSPPVDHAVLNVTTIDTGMIVPVVVEVVAVVAETDEGNIPKEAVALPEPTAIVEVEDVASLPKAVVQELVVSETENTENASVPVAVKSATTIPVSTVEAVVAVAVAESTPATANFHASPVPVESTVLVETTEVETSVPSLKTAFDTVEQSVAVSEKTSEPGPGRNRKEGEKEPENKQENGIGSEPGIGLAVEVESKQNLPVLPIGKDMSLILLLPATFETIISAQPSMTRIPSSGDVTAEHYPPSDSDTETTVTSDGRKEFRKLSISSLVSHFSQLTDVSEPSDRKQHVPSSVVQTYLMRSDDGNQSPCLPLSTDQTLQHHRESPVDSDTDTTTAGSKRDFRKLSISSIVSHFSQLTDVSEQQIAERKSLPLTKLNKNEWNSSDDEKESQEKNNSTQGKHQGSRKSPVETASSARPSPTDSDTETTTTTAGERIFRKLSISSIVSHFSQLTDASEAVHEKDGLLLPAERRLMWEDEGEEKAMDASSVVTATSDKRVTTWPRATPSLPRTPASKYHSEQQPSLSTPTAAATALMMDERDDPYSIYPPSEGSSVYNTPSTPGHTPTTTGPTSSSGHKKPKSRGSKFLRFFSVLYALPLLHIDSDSSVIGSDDSSEHSSISIDQSEEYSTAGDYSNVNSLVDTIPSTTVGVEPPIITSTTIPTASAAASTTNNNEEKPSKKTGMKALMAFFRK